MGQDLAGLFGDALKVLAMALLWGFVAEDELCRGLSPHSDHMSVGMTVELWQRGTGGALQEVRHQITL